MVFFEAQAGSIWYSVEFYCCLFTAVIVAIILYFRYRINQMQRLEAIRQRIARDLHDEIGSTLSSISIMSRMAATGQQNSGKNTGEWMNSIGIASGKAMSLMSDIVWSVNPENDKMENIISRMREYASQTLEASGILLEFNPGASISNLKIPMEHRKDFYLIFKEAINNIAKYSGASATNIQLTLEHRMLKMKISDNGSGFDLYNYPAGNGLKNMRSRAEGLKAKFEIASIPNKGTTISITLPLNR